MRLYRICHVRYLEDLRGLGASYRDGARWNEPGFPIVYFAETPSVAMLEMAHYLPSPRLVPPGYRLGVYEVGDEVALERWHVRDLPEGWDRYPHPRSTRRMGTSWLMRPAAPAPASASAPYARVIRFPNHSTRSSNESWFRATSSIMSSTSFWIDPCLSEGANR